MESGIKNKYLRYVGAYNVKAGLITLNMSGVMKRCKRR